MCIVIEMQPEFLVAFNCVLGIIRNVVFNINKLNKLKLQNGSVSINLNILSTTNKMQRYTVFFIVVSALHVSSGFSAHHQELKNCTCSWSSYSSTLAVAADKFDKYPMLHVQFLSS